MRSLRRAIPSLAFAVALVAAAAVALPVPAAQEAVAPSDPVLGQFIGYPWGGFPIWPVGWTYFGLDFTSPYAGSPGYPYYRYGPYYGSAYGLPYPIYPSLGGDYTSTVGTLYPFYPSAGGVAFGTEAGAGYSAPLGRCLYAASAGYGGSWYDPPSYGYYAPFC